jgi:arginase
MQLVQKMSRDRLFLGIPFHWGQKNKSVSLTSKLFFSQGYLNPDEWTNLGDLSFSKCQALDCCQEIYETVKNIDLKNRFLMLLGGDHGQSLGTIGGLLHHQPDLVVVWIDAHADANTPEASITKNMHGMPLAYLTGESPLEWLTAKLNPENLIYIGLRAVDDYESRWLIEKKVSWISAEEWKKKGPAWLEGELKKRSPKALHVSFDVDALDEQNIMATGCRVKDGLDFSDIETIFNQCAHYTIQSCEFVEIHPSLALPGELQHLFQWIYQLTLKASQTPQASLAPSEQKYSWSLGQTWQNTFDLLKPTTENDMRS